MAQQKITRADFPVLAEKAMQSYNAGNMEQTQQLCHQILAVDKRQPNVLALLGLAEATQGKLQMGEENVRLALTMDPGNAMARNSLRDLEGFRQSTRSSPYFRKFMEDRSVYMDYPRNVGIETVGRCNATCFFCPHGQLDRKFTEMPQELFEKIVRDLKEIPEHLPFNIHPNLVNEPFMDKKFLDRMAFINKELPQAALYIFTNLNVLPKDFFERIHDIKKIDTVNLSFNAANKTEYEASMGIDFERTVGHIKKLIAANREKRIYNGPLVLSRVQDLTDADKRFEGECRALLPEFTYGVDYMAHVKNRADWLGSVDVKQTAIPYTLPCSAWFDINIFTNGTVPHCCFDSKGEYPIGNVNEKSVLEIYNSKPFRMYRERMTSRENISPCNSCALLQ